MLAQGDGLEAWVAPAALLVALFVARAVFMRAVLLKAPEVPPEEKDLLAAYEAQAYAPPLQPNQLKQLAVSRGMTMDQVSEWMRKRRESNEDALRKGEIADCAWSAMCYTGNFVLAFSCFYSTSACPDPLAASRFLGCVPVHLLLVHAASRYRAEHVVTVELIVRAIACFGQFGFIVSMFHDIGDATLDTARLVHHFKWKQLSQALFGVFVASWLVGRLYMFPLALLRAEGMPFLGTALVLLGVDIVGLVPIAKSIKMAYWTGLGDSGLPAPTGDSDSYDSDASLSSALRGETKRE